jgi:hypothetical protein
MMNLAFELRKDKPLRDDGLLQPYKIVSLWDMLRIQAEDFISICNLLTDLSAIFDNVKTKFPDLKTIRKPPIENKLRKLRDISEKMNLRITTDRAEELLEFLDTDDEVDLCTLDHMINALPKKLIAELRAE